MNAFGINLFAIPWLGVQFASPGAELIKLGPLSIRWYGLLIATAIILGTLLAQKLAPKRQVDPEILGDLVIWLVLGAIPAARLYYVAFEWQTRFAGQPIGKIFAIWEGGIAIHGAILGGTIACLLFCLKRKLSLWQLADLVMPPLILGQAIGRWGNFFNSEAFGTPTDLPWKLFIPVEHRPTELINEPYFHPTFLYESLWNLGVLGILLSVFYKFPKAKPGTLVMLYLICYSAGRVWIEGLRTDSLMLGPLRVAQVVSLSCLGFGVLGLAWLYGMKRFLPDVVPASGKPSASVGASVMEKSTNSDVVDSARNFPDDQPNIDNANPVIPNPPPEDQA
jgi:phosphatidylglycerol---prolipoprotein diacylglyceryl transferase